MLPVEAILTRDITSVFYGKKKEPKILALKGEKVTKISGHGNIWIARKENGERIPVNINSLQIITNETKKENSI